MKIKFNTFENVNKFVKNVASLESDVFVKSGRCVVDGRSILGIYSLDLSNELELEVIEKKDGEIDELIKILSEMNILIDIGA